MVVTVVFVSACTTGGTPPGTARDDDGSGATATGGKDAPALGGHAGGRGGTGGSAQGSGGALAGGGAPGSGGEAEPSDGPSPPPDGAAAGGAAGGALGEGGYAGSCPGDPTAGFTPLTDTYNVQHPYDLMASDRFKQENGMYTLWVYPTDKAHQPGNTTAPRTEMRWSNWTTGERMWESDVMFESPLNHTCIMQIHNVGAAIAVYLQSNGGNLRNSVGQDFLKDYYGKWFNLKVAFNPDTLQARVWVNNCLMLSPKSPRGPDPNWYFKNGVYTCNASICRDHFKNLKLWKK
jgi:hypothetical protein